MVISNDNKLFSTEIFNFLEILKNELNVIDSMTADQFKHVQTFFETKPKLEHSVKITNPENGVEHEITLQGLGDFFG